MFMATGNESKYREINLLIDMQINYLNKQINHYFSLSLQQLSWEFFGTKNVSSYANAEFFEGKQIMMIEKIWQKHNVYILVK